MRSVRQTDAIALVLAAFVIATMAGCGHNPAGPGSDSTGTVQGIVTAGDGTTRIGLATVSVVSTTRSTLTDANGAYTLTGVPEGNQTLEAKRGNFSATVAVVVKKDSTTTAGPTALKPVKKLAYVFGAFDAIEKLIIQWGNPIDQLNPGSLSSSAALSQYGMIFVNCGLNQTPSGDPATISALLAWVREGGTLYVSDQAMVYLLKMIPADIIEIDSGDSQTITASIEDADLQKFAGKSSATITYDLPGWVGLVSLSTRSHVLLRGSYLSAGAAKTNHPLAFSVTEGNGRIIYTSFHNNASATADQVLVLRYFVYF